MKLILSAFSLKGDFASIQWFRVPYKGSEDILPKKYAVNHHLWLEPPHQAGTNDGSKT